MRLFIVAIILLISINNVLPLNILAILPYNGKSHFMVFDVYLKELASRGHNVTVISHFPKKEPQKNFNDISLAGSVSELENAFKATEISLFGTCLYLTRSGIRDCEVLLANNDVQSLIKRKHKFDVVVVEQFNSDCALGVAYKIDAPVVGLTSHSLMPYHYQRLGIPDNSAYVPFHFLGGGSKPAFVQRLVRSFFRFYFNTVYYYYTQWMNQRTLAKYFDDIPPLEELSREIKFLLVYHNFMLTGSHLFPANVIEVGGYHVKEAKPLTGNLHKFFNEAEHGVVYISFGSIINSATLPPEKLQAVMEAMKELPQKFIWKWNNDTGLADKNKLYTSNWLPQVDILGHPKTVAFVSHAGMGSTTEALHFGVPMVAMPFFGDQPSNAAAIEESGFGVQLFYKELTKETLVAALKMVLDPNFTKKAKDVANAWRDRPTSPLDTAVFWTEFAAKHPNFTYRTAAADVPLYQYLYLDIIATLVVVLGVFGLAIKTCCNCRSKPPLKHKQNKIKKK